MELGKVLSAGLGMFLEVGLPKRYVRRLLGSAPVDVGPSCPQSYSNAIQQLANITFAKTERGILLKAFFGIPNLV